MSGTVQSAGGRGDSDSGDVDSRRIVRYPDSHQLFVGNLPHDIDENELKEFFKSTSLLCWVYGQTSSAPFESFFFIFCLLVLQLMEMW